MADLNSTGAVLASYAQGAGVDEPLAANLSGTLAFYEADGLGSVTSLTNISGSAVGAYIRDSFGKAASTAETLGNRFRYTGREWDDETGLYYYRARYYDPSVGRFIKEDPIRFVSGMDFYRYVSNRPTQLKDSWGLSERDVQTIIQAIKSRINSMTANGERLENGTLNNLVSGFNTMTGGLIGKPYRGCGEQTNTVINQLTLLIPTLDDNWTFDLQGAFMPPFYHQWGIATSSNSNDPLIIFDPLYNSIATVPPNEVPHGDIHPVK